ncbi:hypothetical protein FRC10_009172 [Ceratobasidium sp. 414]|nr:hypothetical protein FRC10_009172 [Ceratobasidium sp. 414]
MDLLNKFTGQHQGQQGQSGQPQQQGEGGFMGMVNSMAGGGQAGEAKEGGLATLADLAIVAVDWVQQHYMGGGDQSNESALEQAKDEQISDMIRQQFKNATGKDFPIADK